MLDPRERHNEAIPRPCTGAVQAANKDIHTLMQLVALEVLEVYLNDGWRGSAIYRYFPQDWLTFWSKADVEGNHI